MTFAFALTDVDSTVRRSRKADPAFHVDSFAERVRAVAEEPGLGEPALSEQAIETVIVLAAQLQSPSRLRSADISTFYGEIDVSWTCGEKQITLMAFPEGRPSQLHWYQRKADGAPDYDMKEATAAILNERLAWLYA